MNTHRFRVIFKLALGIFIVALSVEGYSQVTTTAGASGDWSINSNWSSGAAPSGSGTVNVNNALNYNVNLTITGTYSINAPLTDLSGGTAYSLTVSDGTSGTLTVNANTVIEGAFTVNNFGNLTVKSGDTLTVGPTTFNEGLVTIESGAVLIVNGDFHNNATLFLSNFTNDGTLIINGDYIGGFGSSVSGSGTINTSGTMSSGFFGNINGSFGVNCNNGPCSSENLCATNTIASDQVICVGQTMDGLTGNNAGTGYTYQWQSSSSQYSGFAAITGATTQDYTPPSTPTTSTYYRRIATKGGCTATSPAVGITISDYPAPHPIITPTNSTICPGGSSTLNTTVSSGTSPFTYTWSPSSSLNSSTSSNPDATPGSTTTYTLVVKDSKNCSNSTNTTITVSTPTVNSSNSNTVCSGIPQNYQITSTTSGATFTWSRAAVAGISNPAVSGQTSDIITETLINTTTANKTVTYKIIPSANGCTGPLFNYIVTVKPSPKMGSIPSDAAYCSGVSVPATANLSSSGTPSATSYTWTNDNTAIGLGASGTGSTSIKVPAFTSANSGSTPLIATITLTPLRNGCGIPSTYTITVNPKPAVNSSTTGSVCTGTPENYNITSDVAGASFTWTRNSVAGVTNGTLSNQTSNPITETLNLSSPIGTAKTVNYIITPKANGCNGTNLTYTVTVNPNPTVGSISASPSAVCSGTPTSLTAIGSGATSPYTYTWSGANLSATNIQTPMASPTSNATYTVTATDAKGCTSSSGSVNVTVKPLPSTPTITPSGATSFCTGCNVTLTSSAGNSYSWSSGQTTQAITVNSSGSYSVTVSNASGCFATSVATVVTVSNNCSYTWLGSVDTDWSNPSNWGLCTVPALTNDVTIPTGVSNMPVISGVATCKGLTVQSGASLTIGASGTLTLAGNFANSGTVTENGTVVFAGTASQTSSGVTSYTNLTINNTSGVSLSTATTVNGILTLTSGALNSSGKLTVNLNTGAIAGTGTGSVTGNITVIKSPGSVEYHFLGNPLTGYTLPWGQFSDDIYIPSGYVYAYNETVVSSDYMDGWVVPSGSLANMKGYAIWFDAANTIDLTGPYNHTYAGNSVNVSNTPSSDATADGWNLLANPYPSTIDWEASSGWTKTNVDQSIYVWDGANNRYASYVGGLGTNGGTQYIPSMQAFWVHCNVAGGTGTVAMNNNIRVTSPVLSMWKLNNENILKLSASSGKYSDETIVRLSEDGTSGFDTYLDAYKMPNDGKNPNFYSKLSGIDYSINTVTDTAQNIVIPVLLNAAFDGTYSIHANNMSSISDTYDVFLIDTLSHIVQNLKQSQTYTFNASVKDTAYRFYLVFKNVNGSIPQVTGVLGSGAGVNIGSNGKNLMVDFGSYQNNVASIQVMNVLGNEVYKNDRINTSQLFNWELSNAPEGIYVVKVIMNSGTYSGKVFLK